MASLNNQDLTATIGPGSTIWKFASHDGSRLFDLTRNDNSPPSKSSICKVSTGASIRVSSQRSALVIIDMQNYFLSEALGRSKGAGHAACEQLIKYAIPAARKMGMKIVWLNWGLTDEDMKTMPPAVTKAFGFAASQGDKPIMLDRHGTIRKDRTYAGLGCEIGEVTVPGSECAHKGTDVTVDAGRTLFRDTWNAALYGPLASYYQPAEGDVWRHKDRMSGLWNADTPASRDLAGSGITTLFFAGVNTDQCVGGSLTDAFSRGYDCILLKDGCGTTSPACAQEAWEFNCENTFGFVTTCKDLYEAVQE